MSIRTVLVVDDDSSTRALICDTLHVYGYATIGACDGVSALRMIRSHGPDCVILDVMMPGLDGHEVLCRIREGEGGADLPVIILSAAAEDAQVWRAWISGVDYFLSKPFNPHELLNFLGYLDGRSSTDSAS